MNSAAGQELAARVCREVDKLPEEMIQFLAELVRLPTVNPPGQDYAECATLLGHHYERLGYAVSLVPAVGRSEHSQIFPRLNVVARLGDGRPALHFNGHFDVVPPGDGWTRPPFGAELREGRLYGRGTSDQKAGLVASIYAIEAIRRLGLAPLGTIVQSATVDEESGGFAGVAYLCQQGILTAETTDYVVITEPLGHDRVCLGHRGVYWFEIVAHGRTAHGSMPTLGTNAADGMADFIGRVNRDLKPRLAERQTAMPVEPPPARSPSINLNSLHGGQLTEGLETPCVPDSCRAVFDRRFIIEESFDQVRAEVVALLDEANAAGPCRYELRDLMVVEPVQTAPDARLARALSGAIRVVTGREARFIASPGTYDQKHVARIGGISECVAYGPGILELAHQPDEYVEIEHLLASAKIMALAALQLIEWRAARA